MKYHFKIYKEKDGYWAECLELEGCLTQAKKKQDLLDNMSEVLNLYLQEPEDSTYLAPFPDDSIRKSKNVVEVAVDFRIAFSFLMRYHRIKHKMTQRQTAKKMGFKDIYSYQRLENHKCNPTLKIISKIKEVFPDFSVDYMFAS